MLVLGWVTVPVRDQLSDVSRGPKTPFGLVLSRFGVYKYGSDYMVQIAILHEKISFGKVFHPI